MASAPAPIASKEALQRLLDGLQTFIREHLALARAEIKDDVKSTARDLAAVAAGIPALLAGYLLLMVALAYVIGLWLPLWASFGIVALVNLAAGGAVAFAGVRKMMQKRVGMPRTGEELQKDKAWLSEMRRDTWQTPAGTPRQFAPESSVPANRSSSP